MLTQVLPIKFDPADYRALKKASKDLGIPMAQIVREAIQKKLKNHKTPQKQPKLSDLAKYAIPFKDHLPHLTDDEILYGNRRHLEK